MYYFIWSPNSFLGGRAGVSSRTAQRQASSSEMPQMKWKVQLPFSFQPGGRTDWELNNGAALKSSSKFFRLLKLIKLRAFKPPAKSHWFIQGANQSLTKAVHSIIHIAANNSICFNIQFKTSHPRVFSFCAISKGYSSMVLQGQIEFLGVDGHNFLPVTTTSHFSRWEFHHLGAHDCYGGDRGTT